MWGGEGVVVALNVLLLRGELGLALGLNRTRVVVHRPVGWLCPVPLSGRACVVDLRWLGVGLERDQLLSDLLKLRHVVRPKVALLLAQQGHVDLSFLAAEL